MLSCFFFFFFFCLFTFIIKNGNQSTNLKKKIIKKQHFGSASSCEGNYGRESNFETMDGKMQRLETTEHGVFVQAYH